MEKKKLVIVGDGDTGKTCLLSVFCKGVFPQMTQPTTFDQFTKEMNIGGMQIELSLWDTAGQEEYERLRPLSYADADVILMCYAIDRPDSLHNIPDIWIPEMQYFCPHVPIVLVATKKDLRYDPNIAKELTKKGEKPVTYDEGEAMARKIQCLGFHETSALNNEGVSDVFDTACRVTFKRYSKRNKNENQCKCSLQ